MQPLKFFPMEENLCFPLLTLFRDGRVIFKDRHNVFPTSGNVYLGLKVHQIEKFPEVYLWNGLIKLEIIVIVEFENI